MSIILIFAEKFTAMSTEINLEAAYEKLSTLKAGALFMKMGAKKTKMALDLIKNKQNEIDFIVWIAPASFLSWAVYEDEIGRNLDGLNKEIYFFSIESISVSDHKYLQLYDLVDKYRVFCVVDESITIKNTEAGRTRRLLHIRSKFTYRLILSGLPLTQGLVDLYSQIEFMHPKVLNMSESQFMNQYLSPYEDGTQHIKRWSNPENEKSLIEKMRPYIFVCDLDVDYNLNYIDSAFDLTEKEERSYQDEKDEFLKDKCQVAFMEVAQKFQHIYTISKNKVEALFKLVEEILERQEKVIIYIKFLDEIRFFKECGWFKRGKYVVLSGRSNKKKAVRMFEKRIDIMFSTYGVDSQGLDLRLCNNIVYFSQTFDYKCKLQSLHNIYQSGENREVNVYNFWVNTGLDNLIKKNLNRKENVLSNVCRIISREEALNL